jgi:hypothetical protein
MWAANREMKCWLYKIHGSVGEGCGGGMVVVTKI